MQTNNLTASMILLAVTALAGCTGEVATDPSQATDHYGPSPDSMPYVSMAGEGSDETDTFSSGLVMAGATAPGADAELGEAAETEPTEELGTEPATDDGADAPEAEPAAPPPATPPAATPPAATPPAATPPAATPPPATPPAATPPPATPPAAAPTPGAAPYPLPSLPAELAIRWPAPPVIARTVNVTTLAAATTAAATAGTRVHVTGAIGGRLEVRANDVEIEFAPGASCDVVFVGKGLARIAIRGGTVEHFENELPAAWDGSAMQYRRELMTTDLLIDGLTASAVDTAFFLRAGVRVALVNSHGTAGRYSVWMGDTGDFNSEDVIVAGNTFSSAGPEATYRLVNVVRSVTVDNRIENHGGIKHNYRIHGRSDLNFASGNVLVNSGVMLGTMATDSIGRQWFVDNDIYHTTPSLLEIQLDTASVTLRGNSVHSNVWTCLLCRETPAGWTVADNTMSAYVAPPAR